MFRSTKDRASRDRAPFRPGHVAGYLGLVMRSVLVVLLLGMSGTFQAQDEESLTQEFPELSAKERSRIAEREAAEAPRDEAFQAVMRTAEELFRSGRYEESLDRYLEARRMRPYNVFPKVKIQDLQALLAKQAEEQGPAEVPTGALAPAPGVVVPAEGTETLEPGAVVPVAVTETPEPPIERAAEVTVVPSTASSPPEEAKLAKEPSPEVPMPKVVAPVTGTPGPDKEIGATPAEGTEERRYREGRAEVLERRVTLGGQTTVYRMVRHPWGAVFHFKDGEAISATAWDQAFPREGR